MTNWGPVNMLATHLDPKSADVKICPLVKSYIFGLFTGSTSSKSENQVKWCHHWIGLEKLPQNDPLNIKIRPVDQKLPTYLYVVKDAISAWSLR